MPLRRLLAIVAIVVLVVAFVGVGITAALVAGRQVTKIEPSPTAVTPTPTPTVTATPLG